MLTKDKLQVASDRLYDYVCDLCSAQDVQVTMSILGLKVDLRCWSANTIEAVDYEGNVYTLEV